MNQTPNTEGINENGLAVLLHNFGRRPARPAGARVLDWSDVFSREETPRRIPGPEIWTAKLWPELAGLAGQFPPPGLVRLSGTPALSAAFAFGHTFMQVGRYRLAVEQTPPVPPQTWFSDEPAPAGQAEPEFSQQLLPGRPALSEGVVIVDTLPRRGDGTVPAEVGTYLGEPDVFKEFGDSVNGAHSRYNLEALRELLMRGFDEADLRDLCYYNPPFRAVCDQLANLTGKRAIVQCLLEYTERQLLFEELLGLLQGKNPRRYEQFRARLRQPEQTSRKFGAVLLLEAEMATRQGRFLGGWEAAALARSSQPLLRKFVGDHRLNRLHLFLATPVGMAVFLGHQWNAIGGVEVQCYEWAGLTGQYLPSCQVALT